MKKRVFLRISAKKAQREVSIGTLLLLLLGIGGLALVILGFYNYWGKFSKIPGQLPGDLEVVAQSCEISAKSGLKTSYCIEFKEIKLGGKKQYVNCPYLLKIGADIPSSGNIQCDKAPDDTNYKAVKGFEGDYDADRYCKRLRADSDYEGKTIINGIICPKGENSNGEGSR